MQKLKNILLVAILIIQLVKCYCNKQRFEGGPAIDYSTIGHLLPLMPHMSFHSNLHYLPEKAIYCTRPVNSSTEHYKFLQKYYSAIRGKPDSYIDTLDCIYPRSVEFPELSDEEPVENLDEGEQQEQYKTIDVKTLTDHQDKLEGSAPNGIICEHLKFNGINKEGTALDIKRSVCYPAQRPPVPTTTSSTATK